MSSPTFPVDSSTPVTIFRRQQLQTAYNLYNISTTGDIYLDDSPQTPGTTTGVPLHPGAQITWEAGRECYAICAPGVSATLLTSPAAGSYFDPYTLALNLLTLAPSGQTLAQQIAANIAISGAPPIDQPATLYAVAQIVPSGVTPNTTAAIDVSRFQQVTVWTVESGAVTNQGYRKVVLNWYADAAATSLIQQQSYYYGAFNGNAGQRVAVPPGTKGLRVSYTSAVTTNNVTLTTSVTGSMRSAIGNSSYNGDFNAVIWAGTGAESTGFAGIFQYQQNGAIAAGTTNMYPQSYEGNAYLTCTALSVTTSWAIDIIDLVAVQGFVSINFGASANPVSATQSLIIPRRPLWLRSRVTGGVNTPNISLVMSPW